MTEPERASVVIVEDHALLAQTLVQALAAEGVATVAAAPRSAAAVLAVVEEARPELVLLDLELGPTVGDGVALIGPVLALGCRVLVVTGSTRRARVAAAVEAGAVGYVLKSAPFDELLATVAAARAGRPVLDEADRFDLLTLLRRERAGARARREPFERLSPREGAVLRALAEGRPVEDIARARRVSSATVRSQVRGILTKLGVSSQLAAVAVARSSGWLDEPER